MARTLLLVGTRKGCFLVEGDGDRREWALRGPFCEAWPVYHAVHDPSTGAIFAAAASEWHGSAVWRSGDLGETWTLSSEGLEYDAEAGRKLSKVSTLAVSDGRVLVGVEAPGIFESRDGGATWSLLTTLAGQPGSDMWDDPANQPQGPSSPPSESVLQKVSTSACVSQNTWNEIASLNVNSGPPFKATNGWPSTSKLTVITVPSARGPAEP